jgi:hypothetical protein
VNSVVAKYNVVDRNAIYFYFLFTPPKKILHIKFLDINAYRIWWENVKVGDHLEDPRVRERKILNMVKFPSSIP